MAIEEVLPTKQVTAEDIFQITQKVAKDVAKYLQDNNISKDKVAILGVSRGGLVPAQYLAYALDIRDVYTIQSKLYFDKEIKKEIHEIAGVYNIDYDNFDVILLVDDIYDSGYTITQLINLIYETAFSMSLKNFEILPVVLYTQKSKKKMKKHGIIYGEKVKKIRNKSNGKKVKPWILFPWDVFESNLINIDEAYDESF